MEVAGVKVESTHPGRSLWDLVERRADMSPGALLATDELGRRLTFAAYRDRCRTLAVELAARGVRGGDVVSWQMPTWLESLVLTGALDFLRTIQNPLLPQLRAREVGFIVSEVAASWYIHPGTWRGYDYSALGSRLVDDVVPSLGTIEIGRPHLPERDGEVVAPVATGRDERTDHWYFYTSGTTGVPKGVRHGHESVAAATSSMCAGMQIVADDHSVVAFPFTHIGGINWLMASLMTGCSLLVVESFAAPETMDLIAGEPVTLAGVTTAFHLAYLAEQRERGPDRPLLPRVRAYPGGAAPKPRTLQQDLVETVGGVGIISGFGLTEFPMITMNSIDDPASSRAISEGRPSPGVEVAIVGADGRECGPGEDGEICARGPHRMSGYVDASLDEAVFDADGFFHTGDLGHLDPDGFLVVTGRLKDVIVRKGENISAREVEELIFSHPDVADVAVVGLPDGERGELVCAAVTVVAGRSVDFDRIVSHLRDLEVMSQKFPERVVVVDELPRNDSGKIVKSELRDRLVDRGGTT
ncbi:MAG: class I adenylate-forming enzyme family protein [Ilumatobacteraceae bacterium]|nr:class I adenylate-forming enzyme family protein [Ilumatobacteraceae bacterium]